ncbi:hypothetical protein HK105_200929 [Polyrhizophydium stewartii]|uniref:Uncharacterized protein n=1 Tax=Polyrhizophydium stewartii TaxID=2732419 RepID=A0ABR4NIG2_9FUNG
MLLALMDIKLDVPSLAGQRISGTVRVPAGLLPCKPPVVSLTGRLLVGPKADPGAEPVLSRQIASAQTVATLSGASWKFTIPLAASLPPSFDAAAHGMRIQAKYELVAVTSSVADASGAEHRTAPVAVQVDIPPQAAGNPTTRPIGADNSLPLGAAGVVSVGFSSPQAAAHLGQALRLSLCVRNDSTMDVTSWAVEVVASVRIDAPPQVLKYEMPIQLVTFGKVAAGKTVVKRVPVHLATSLPPSTASPSPADTPEGVAIDVDFCAELSATTASGKTVKASTSELRVVRSTTSEGESPIPDEDDLDEWVAGISISQGSQPGRVSVRSAGTGVPVQAAVAAAVAANASSSTPSPASSSSFTSPHVAAEHEIDSIFDGEWRRLELDQWISGKVSINTPAMFYFDLDADLTMRSADSFLDDDDDDGRDAIGPSAYAGVSRLRGSPPSKKGHMAAREGPGGRRVTELPGVILVSSTPAALRISKGPNRPNWIFYEHKEESRTLMADSSEEQVSRFTRGPGRYYIAVYCDGLSGTVDFEIAVRSIQGLKDSDPMRFLSFWHPASSLLGAPSQSAGPQLVLPRGAWQTGTDVNGDPLYTVRAYHRGGLHIGKIGVNTGGALIPWGGKEVLVLNDYEVLAEIPGSRWVKVLNGAGVPPNAIPGGHETDGKLLYIARATVKESILGASGGAATAWVPSLLASAIEGRSSLCPGKAGPHMNGCNVAFNGVEVSSITPFEVLVYDDPPAFEEEPSEKKLGDGR